MALVETPTVPLPEIPSATTALLTHEIPTNSAPTKNISVGKILALAYCTTIADLKNMQTRDGLTVRVAGYGAVNDGGGGKFRYNAASVEADNGCTKIVPNSGIGCWYRLYSGPVRPEWAGGIPTAATTSPGTGVDCSIPINLVKAVSRNILLSDGRYRINSKISINTSNSCFYGAGKDITFVDWFGAGEALESYVAWGAGSSLGYIKWGGFTLTNLGSGTTKGFKLGLFTLGCSVERVKIVSFAFGVDVQNAYYANFILVDFAGNGVGMQFADRCNGMQLLGCKFVTDATPAATSMHLKSAAVLTATTYGLVLRDCFFDGQGTAGMVSLEEVKALVIQGCYFEVYTASAHSITVLNFGTGMVSANVSGNIMIGPDDASWSGKWVHSSHAASNSHVITGNRQYRASSATFLTTTAGNYNIRYTDNSLDAPDGTIPAGTVKVNVIPVALPATTGDVDTVVPAFTTPAVTGFSRVRFTPSDAVDLTNRFLRVDTIVAGARTNILNFDFNTHSPNPVLDLGETVDCGSLGAMSANIQLLVYIHKVGTALVAPACTVAFEHYD